MWEGYVNEGAKLTHQLCECSVFICITCDITSKQEFLEAILVKTGQCLCTKGKNCYLRQAQDGPINRRCKVPSVIDIHF